MKVKNLIVTIFVVTALCGIVSLAMARDGGKGFNKFSEDVRGFVDKSEKVLSLADKAGLVDEEKTMKVVFWIGGILLVVVSLLVYLGIREIRRKFGNGERRRPHRHQVLYFLAVLFIGAVALWTKDLIVQRMWWIVFKIWLFFFLSGKIYRIWRHFGLPEFPEWTRGVVILPALGYIASYLGMYLLLMLWSVAIVKPLTVEAVPPVVDQTSPVKKEETFVFESPVEWTSPVKPPDGVVIPNVWDEILLGVQDEGGTEKEALLLYNLQRTECQAVDGQCVSSVGAEGWFQFMPSTWPSYADSDWSQYNLRQSTRAAYRMFKKLELFEQADKADFQNRFAGMDGGMVWNAWTPDPGDYDGYDQAGRIWDSYQAGLLKAFEQERAEAMPPPKEDQEGVAKEEGQAAPDSAQPVFPLTDKSWVTTVEFPHDAPEAEDYGYAGNPCHTTDPKPIVASIDGEVTFKIDVAEAGGGNTMLVIRNEVWTALYLHLDIDDEVGSSVLQGQTVGIVASYGNAYGAGGCEPALHLHYSLCNNLTGVCVDPDATSLNAR